MAEGRGPEAYEYLSKAYSIDPTANDVAFDLGSLRISLPFDTLYAEQEVMRSFSMMAPYVKSHPDDAVKAQYYAYNAIELDTLAEALATYKALSDARPDNPDYLPMLAETYMRMGDSENALAVLSRYELIDGYSPEVTLRKASYHIGVGDTVGAIEESDRLLASNPRLSQYHVLRAQLMRYLNRPDSAYASLLRAEELDPQDGTVQYALAEYFRSVGDSVAYDERIYNALLAESFGLDSKISILSDYLQSLSRDKLSVQKGDTLFKVLGDQYPHEAPLLKFGAAWAAFKEDYPKAVEQIRYAIDLDPANVEYRTSLMSYLIAADRPLEAMKEYGQAVAQTGEDTDLTLMYAAAAQEADSIGIVRTTFTKLIHDLVPEFPLDERITDKSPARSLSFMDIYRLSTYYQAYGDATYAHFQKNPANKQLLDTVYNAYENSLMLISDNSMALNNYAFFLCENEGDLEKAKEMSSRAITYDSSSTNLDTYAWILFRMGDYKEARTYQEAALEKASEEGVESDELYSHYGDILFMNGEPDLAVEYWEKALEISPDDELLKKKVAHRTFFYN